MNMTQLISQWENVNLTEEFAWEYLERQYKDSFVNLDLFPFIIQDSMKYQQAEVFYKKYSNKLISSDYYKTCEQKFQSFYSYMWLYNKTYGRIDGMGCPYNKLFYKKGPRKVVKQLYCEKMTNSEEFCEINTLEKINLLSLLGLREVGCSYIFFQDYQMLIKMIGFSPVIFLKDLKYYNNLMRIANICGLSLL